MGYVKLGRLPKIPSFIGEFLLFVPNNIFHTHLNQLSLWKTIFHTKIFQTNTLEIGESMKAYLKTKQLLEMCST